VDGNRYIDFISGLGAITLGHCYPGIQEAVIEHTLGVGCSGCFRDDRKSAAHWKQSKASAERKQSNLSPGTDDGKHCCEKNCSVNRGGWDVHILCA